MNDTSTTIAHSVFSRVESGPDTDPESAFWSAAPAILFAADTHGAPQPDLSTEVRSRWTFDNLYLLFPCAYDANEPLNLKPDRDLEKETNETLKLGRRGGIPGGRRQQYSQVQRVRNLAARRVG